jgi:5'-3' exoribonuclease 2
MHDALVHNRDAQSNKSAAAKLKELMKAKADGTASDAEPTQESGSASGAETPVQLGKRKADDMEATHL